MVTFHPKDDMQAGSVGNQLRPEVVESLFYMWRFTGDVRYQQWAWRIFLAFEKYSKVESGYAGLEVRLVAYDLLPASCMLQAGAKDMGI